MAGSKVEFKSNNNKTLNVLEVVQQLPDTKHHKQSEAHLNAQKILQSRWMSTAQNSACAYSFKTFYVPNFSKHREQSQKDKSEIEDIEPLPFLAAYQERNQPSYIHEQNRLALLQKVVKKSPITTTDKFISRPTVGIKIFSSDSSTSATSSVFEYQHVVPVPPKYAAKKKRAFYRNLSKMRSITRIPLEHHSLEEIIASGLSDPFKIIDILKKNKQIGFFYLASNADPSTNEYSHYNIKVIPFEEIDPNNYATISLTGVTKSYQGEVEFTSLQEWEAEYKLYQQLLELPVFKLFRLRQAFYDWHKTVRQKIMAKYSKALQKNLFFLNPFFRSCLLKLSKMLSEFGLISLYSIKLNHNYSMKEFCSHQFQWLAKIRKKLARFRFNVRDIVKKVCSELFVDAGFASEGFYYDTNSCSFVSITEKLALIPFSVVKEHSPIVYDPPHKMTFSEQANKKSLCLSVARFIRLVDFLICNTLHTVLTDSLSTLFDNLNKRLLMAPSFAEIKSWKKEVELLIKKDLSFKKEIDLINENEAFNRSSVVAKSSKSSKSLVASDSIIANSVYSSEHSILEMKFNLEEVKVDLESQLALLQLSS